jgi:hypothetical protein
VAIVQIQNYSKKSGTHYSDTSESHMSLTKEYAPSIVSLLDRPSPDLPKPRNTT